MKKSFKKTATKAKAIDKKQKYGYNGVIQATTYIKM